MMTARLIIGVGRHQVGLSLVAEVGKQLADGAKLSLFGRASLTICLFALGSIVSGFWFKFDPARARFCG